MHAAGAGETPCSQLSSGSCRCATPDVRQQSQAFRGMERLWWAVAEENRQEMARHSRGAFAAIEVLFKAVERPAFVRQRRRQAFGVDVKNFHSAGRPSLEAARSSWQAQRSVRWRANSGADWRNRPMRQGLT